MFGQLHVGRGTTRGAMTIFPVWHAGAAVRGLSSGAGLVEVSEREGSPAVENLVVANTTDRPVLLVEGEVWRRVARQQDVHGPSATGSLLDAMDSPHVRTSRGP